MNFLSNVPQYVLDFFGTHLDLLIGYAICVVFPIPWLNSAIIDLWAKMLKSSPVQPNNNTP